MGKRNRGHRRRRRRAWKKHAAHPPAGVAPGTLRIPAGAPLPVLHLIAYGPDEVLERRLDGIGELAELRRRWPVVWVDVDGLGDATVLEELQREFGLHRLAMEDVVNVGQRAKVEPYDDFLFLVVHIPDAAGVSAAGARTTGEAGDGARRGVPEQREDAASGRASTGAGETEQLGIFLGDGFVVTVQERPGDCFDVVRERLRAGKGALRRSGAGYLAYALVDAVVDAYFPVLERLGAELELLEDEVLAEPDEKTVHKVLALKGELLTLRRILWPHRDALHALLHETEFIGAENAVYLRDVYDHAVRCLDLLETYREIAADLMSTYLSAVSNRMNEVMKMLTMIATIFIPLSFLAGIYGMNFNPDASRWSMPELDWAYGYPALLVLMAAVAIGFLLYFRRKGWL